MPILGRDDVKIWLPGRVSTSSDCKSAASCNQSLTFSETSVSMNFYPWMEIKGIDLKGDKNCAIIDKDGKIEGKDCNEENYVFCRKKCSFGKYFTSSQIWSNYA